MIPVLALLGSWAQILTIFVQSKDRNRNQAQLFKISLIIIMIINYLFLKPRNVLVRKCLNYSALYWKYSQNINYEAMLNNSWQSSENPSTKSTMFAFFWWHQLPMKKHEDILYHSVQKQPIEYFVLIKNHFASYQEIFCLNQDWMKYEELSNDTKPSKPSSLEEVYAGGLCNIPLHCLHCEIGLLAGEVLWCRHITFQWPRERISEHIPDLCRPWWSAFIHKTSVQPYKVTKYPCLQQSWQSHMKPPTCKINIEIFKILNYATVSKIKCFKTSALMNLQTNTRKSWLMSYRPSCCIDYPKAQIT